MGRLDLRRLVKSVAGWLLARRPPVWMAAAVALVLSGGVLFLVRPAGEAPADGVERVGRAPVVSPDLGGVTLPPNIAPLNFRVEEEGSRFFARIHSDQGRALEVWSRDGRILIPRRPWSRLLDVNRGRELRLDVFAGDGEGRWRRFDSLTCRIAPEDVDGFVAYRNMHPTRSSWTMRIACRDLSCYDETEVLRYDSGFEAVGVNCHTPLRNDPARMLIGVRSTRSGAATLLIAGGKVKKIGMQFGYTSWHPSGRLAVFSVNDFPIFFIPPGDRSTTRLTGIPIWRITWPTGAG